MFIKFLNKILDFFYPETPSPQFLAQELKIIVNRLNKLIYKLDPLTPSVENLSSLFKLPPSPKLATTLNTGLKFRRVHFDLRKSTSENLIRIFEERRKYENFQNKSVG